MKINENRMKERMDAINSIAVTPEGGMMRLALSDQDKEARDLLAIWMREAGMSVEVDDLGSMYGILQGADGDALPVSVGSHLDTQPNGGKYDGLFGVMAGLEAICAIKDAGIKTKSPLMLINWTNEEGARFVPPMLASGVAAGNFDAEWVKGLEDKEGFRYGDELERIGYAGSSENRFAKAKYYIEPHIEQGPVLDAEGLNFGIVTGALGITGLNVRICGEANHAGTTPMRLRKDAMMAAADSMMQISDYIINYGDPAVVTFGIVSTSPGSKNIIPSLVYFSVDMRYHTDSGLTAIEDTIRTIIKTVCEIHGVTVEIERYWRADPVQFDGRVVDAIAAAAETHKLKFGRIISGAGHDAVFISKIVPTGMLFVPSIGGMSHCPQENTRWEDIAAGTEVLADVIFELDK